MSRLHKKITISLLQKYYIAFFFCILFGIFKNGLLPYVKGYSNISETITILILPILCFGIGFIFDLIFKNREMFNNRFFALLFLLMIPVQSNLLFVLLFLCICLFLYNYIKKWQKNSFWNWMVGIKLFFVFLLISFHSYGYENVLELSKDFQYSFLDSFIGFHVSGLYISSTMILFLFLFIFCFDYYYKKEIVLYSYGIFGISLLVYSLLKENMGFMLMHLLDSNILFPLIFIAPLSLFSPYSKKGKWLYGILIGILTLPCICLTNVYEGTYIAIFFVNILFNLLNLVIKSERNHIKKVENE